MKAKIIALLTDFGDEDYFVASLKAVILSLNPRVRLVDISHHIPSFNIDAAGFVLAAACPFFPPKTIFLAVVDPGVGTSRKIVLVETARYFFIAPDNGLLTLVLAREKVKQVREVSNPKFFLGRKSKTFEARDKMAPVAAWVSLGQRLDAFGPALPGYKKRNYPEPEVKDGEVHGLVLYADKFGNLVTNIPAALVRSLEMVQGKGKATLLAGSRKLGSYRETYGAAKKGEVFFLKGSLGLIEVAVREGSAQKRTGLHPGIPVRIVTRRV
ncbi:MAG: SAM hydrolase/SAM-dependent halogenase family protein [Candidatus Aminicenantales bacterium]